MSNDDQPRNDNGEWTDGEMGTSELTQMKMNSPLNTVHVDNLANEMSVAGKYVGEPVMLETMGNGNTYLTDGHHRLAAAIQAGITTLPTRTFANTDAGRHAANKAISEIENRKTD